MNSKLVEFKNKIIEKISSGSGTLLLDSLVKDLSFLFDSPLVFICDLYADRRLVRVASSSAQDLLPTGSEAIILEKTFQEITAGIKIETVSNFELTSEIFFPFLGFNSFCNLPLFAHSGEVSGFLSIADRHCSLPDEEEKELMKLLVSRLSVELEHLQMENKILTQSNYLEGILRSTPDIILIVDKNYKIIERFAGGDQSVLPYEEVSGKHLSEILSQETSSAIISKLTEFGKITSKDSLEYSVVRGGELRYRQALARKIDGSGDEYMIVIRDQTEKKRSEKLKDDIERIMRHDLKNPLNVITGMAQLLLREKNSSESDELARTIYEQARKMLKMTNDALQMFRMEEGVYRPERKKLELSRLLNNSINATRELAQANDIYFEFSGINLTSDTFVVSGEEILLENMLSNLFRNAVEASPKNEKVLVSVRTDGNKLFLSIHNRGAIPEEIKEHFFEPYSTSGKKSGTGLGTYSAMLIAKTHGGTINFISSEADGTTITVVLPSGDVVV